VNCGTCKHYSPDEDPHNMVPTEMRFGDCGRIKHGNDCEATFDFEDHDVRGALEELDAELVRLAKEEKACTQDGSGYRASLRVKPDFGCVLWEKA